MWALVALLIPNGWRLETRKVAMKVAGITTISIMASKSGFDLLVRPVWLVSFGLAVLNVKSPF